MIDLVLVRFIRDHTPFRTGMTAAFSPAVAESYKKNRVAEIIGPIKKDVDVPQEKPKDTARAKLEKK